MGIRSAAEYELESLSFGLKLIFSFTLRDYKLLENYFDSPRRKPNQIKREFINYAFIHYGSNIYKKKKLIFFLIKDLFISILNL